MEIDIKVDREITDYETINDELYIRASELVRVLVDMEDFELEEILKDGLGLDKEGNRL